jgi:hypothetical protein
MVTGIKRKMLDIALQRAITSEVKRLAKDGIEPTIEIVLKNANEGAIAMLLGQGYTTEELIKTTEDTIRRQECKG